MLKLTRQSDYAMLFLESLSIKGSFIPLSELVRQTKLPQRFLARIAAQLAKHNIVESKEGKVGGYKLTKNAQDVNLYDFFKIFEGDLSLVKCSKPGYRCRYNNLCKHRVFVRHTLDGIISQELKKWKIKHLFSS